MAVPELHHPGLTEHGTLIEFGTADESMMGKVGKDLGAHVIRCSENHLNVEDTGTMKVLHDIVCRPLGFLAVRPMVTMADTYNSHQYGQAFADELETGDAGPECLYQEVLQTGSRCGAKRRTCNV